MMKPAEILIAQEIAYRKQFGARLKEARLQSRLTMLDLGVRINHMNIHWVKRVESGDRGVSAFTAVRLAEAVRVDAGWLLTGEVRRREE